MSREIEIEWRDFGVTVTVELLDDENPRLCDRFWQALPFETVFMDSMSPGEVLVVPMPLALHPTPKEKLVFLPDEPPGVVVANGALACLFITYGIVVEPFSMPRIGRIAEKELEKLRSVVTKIRDAYLYTKELNVATVRRK